VSNMKRLDEKIAIPDAPTVATATLLSIGIL
jgi:hypothetical protein